MFDRKILFSGPFLILMLFFAGCSSFSESVNNEEWGEKIESVDAGGSTISQIEEDMNAELVYDGEPELVNPVEFFATIDKNGILAPQAFYAHKGEYVLIKILNNSKEEHAIIIPEYGWRTILHKGKETEFGFRARDVGVFPFHCSQYCIEKEHHIRGTIYVE